MSLALFDLDNTLIAGDSDHSWGEFLVEQAIVEASTYRQRNDEFYRAYQRGELDIQAYLEFALEPLTQLTTQQLTQLRQQFVREKIEPLRLKKAEALLADHRRQGDTLVIITSTNRFITEPIARLLQVDALLATEPEIQGERYTGKILFEPCYQQGKIAHLERWLMQHPHPLENSFFYSDSINDRPLLERVGHPVAVDPDPTLHQLAQAKGWPVISLREVP